MGKNSQKRKADRRAKRQEWANSVQARKIAEIEEKSLIPSYLATNAAIDDWQEHRSIENFRLIFASYNSNQCEIHLLNRENRVKPLIEMFKKITTLNPSNIGSSGIVRDNVKNDGHYKPLFKTVPGDVELKEVSFAGTGRLYFYLFKNYFCVVSVQANHRNT